MDIGDSCGHGVVELVDILMKLLASIDVRQGASTSMWTATSCRKHPQWTVYDALSSVTYTVVGVDSIMFGVDSTVVSVDTAINSCELWCFVCSTFRVFFFIFSFLVYVFKFSQYCTSALYCVHTV